MKHLLATLVALASLAAAQSTYKLQNGGAPPSDVPSAVRQVLQPQGSKVVGDNGSEVADVWFRKNLPVQATGAKSSDVLYPQLSVGEFIGVLRFPGGGSDFRGQSIKAGTYTLRYALVPKDGNHMGVSTYRDFALLLPEAQDQDASKNIAYQDLLKLSRQASGTGHPAVMYLTQAASGDKTALTKDDSGHWVLNATMPTSTSGPLPLGLIVVGKTDAQ